MRSDYKKDQVLGHQIKELLKEYDFEGPYTLDKSPPVESQVWENVEKVLGLLRIDPKHPSTLNTSLRFTRVLMEDFTWGLNYGNFPAAATFPAQGYDELVIIKDIKVHSLCEHHFVPIIGIAHVGYIADELTLGLSKFNRIVDFFSRRPQQQERLTLQIITALKHILSTSDVAVVIEAEHFCTRYRGIEDPCSSTVTSAMHGRFREKPELRQEFLTLKNGSYKP